MFASLIRGYTFQILLEVLRRAREDQQDLLLEAYWDLVYLYRYGLPEIKVELRIPWPPQPQPDPSPMSSGLVRDSLLLDILDLALGDPNPQPNRLREFLGNKQIRINAVKNLLEHFQGAIPQLQAEIRRLEGLQ